jgi:predicted ATPase
MLTRLKVDGFKNLVDIDVRFGPFTCIAGANGSGKSNLFDAIRFLSALADEPLVDAALSLRGDGGGLSDIRNLFHRVGDSYAPEMTFEAEMIIPPTGIDDLGQEATTPTTLLRYHLTLRYRGDHQPHLPLEIVAERLEPGEVADIAFPYSAEWLSSAVQQGGQGPFISTEGDQIIRWSAPGTAKPLNASALPRTVVSAAVSAHDSALLLARREMQSWRLLQLEPSSLRQSDEFTAPTMLGDHGEHLASTLYELARNHRNSETSRPDPEQIYVTLSNRLYELLDEVREVWVDRDEKREQLTVYLTERNGTAHPTRFLSDGTLRFLALAVMELDARFQGVICLEEPENGIHPGRIAAMIDLLRRIATDTRYPADEDNPLRQVIISTHSPGVVQQVPSDSVLFAELVAGRNKGGQAYRRVRFLPLSETWRTVGSDTDSVNKVTLVNYLYGISAHPRDLEGNTLNGTSDAQRVVERDDVQELMQLAIQLGEDA